MVWCIVAIMLGCFLGAIVFYELEQWYLALLCLIGIATSFGFLAWFLNFNAWGQRVAARIQEMQKANRADGNGPPVDF